MRFSFANDGFELSDETINMVAIGSTKSPVLSPQQLELLQLFD